MPAMSASKHGPVSPRGVLRVREPLARHVWWGVGGAAERFYEPVDAADLAVFLAGLPQGEPLLWLGFGSNVLVRDGGVRGTVICTTALAEGFEYVDAVTVRAGAGMACPKLAKLLAREGLTGLEFLAGVPGTLGGALGMNAGAHGGETWECVRRVETIDRSGARRWRERDAYRVAYRSVEGPQGEWFLGAELSLAAATRAGCEARIRELLRRRAATQPTGQRSCGSVFRNPPGDHAGRLIESCGLKGLRYGGALVSPRHANFIVTDGACMAADIEALIELVTRAVESRTGVRLQPEVRVVGEPAGGDA